ncbi:MAG: UDP-glucose/GDP-mannose dehydrogenase family protein [Myxococcota bacterium]|nr:UDP-glucose/GDP-mannose dehydrogenase family protein [Myxococcota bacterium]
MKIAVMGTGYVGLVAGTCFAELGNHVTCIDVNQDKIDKLEDGIIPIYEPGLDTLVKRNVAQNRLHFTTQAPDAIRDAKVVFIAVGTPQSHDGSADLKYVCAVAETIGEYLTVEDAIVVCKSTVPIGTNERVRSIVAERSKVAFHIVSNPEFLKEGAAIQDFMKPDRIVVGSESDHAVAVMDSLYGPLVRTGAPIIHMDVASAEMTKYAANSMLATRISFMNEIANLCSAVGADVSQVRRGMGTDRRIGKHFLFPGVGYGGSCFPKDVRALRKTARAYGAGMRILDSVDEVNEAQKMRIVTQVVSRYGDDLSNMHFGIWGLAFKAQTDDMREAPSLVIINALLERGATVSAFDPQARETAHEELGESIQYANNVYDAAEGADALLVVTDWAEFRHPDMDRVLGLMKESPSLFDGRNLYDPEGMRAKGFAYYSIGRGANPTK